MKLKQLLITVVVTIISLFFISILLDFDWIQAEIARIILVYLMMGSVFCLAFLIGKEILK